MSKGQMLLIYIKNYWKKFSPFSINRTGAKSYLGKSNRSSGETWFRYVHKVSSQKQWLLNLHLADTCTKLAHKNSGYWICT